MEDQAEPEAARQAQRLAPWSIILMVAAAMALTVAVVLDLLVVAILAGIVGFVGVGLLALTAVKGGRKDAPRP